MQQRVAAFTHAVIYDRAGYGWSEPGPYPRTSHHIHWEQPALVAATIQQMVEQVRLNQV